MNPSSEFQEALQRAKLDALKELAYGASHEINNPLANIAARAQSLLRDEADAERRRALEAIHQQALRAHEMISDLMLFARPPQLQPRPTEVGAILEQLRAELAPEFASRDILFTLAADPPPPPISADSVQLAVAIKALLVNSMQAIGRDGRVEATARVEPAQGVLAVAVRDSGPGIPERVREHMFDPFYSGREAGRGLGFGLSKCWRIVQLHGGRVQVRDAPEGGALIAIELPLPAPGA
ncbi:MAG TPA: HAMP domain-containing sensor histidine kinase [Lacipirellulaceae bacterium]|nr:HAMP domain-containing sensor histidine kinase [Lacipirellulaceae bacterium]